MRNIFPINFPIIELTRRTLLSGGISFKGVLILFGFYIKLIFALPFSILQFILYSGKINNTKLAKSPVFILGHYRSGTTLLHKMMACDEQFGFLTNYDMICPNSSLLFGKPLQQIIQFLINKLQIKTAFFNNVIPQLSEPAEEDRYLINKGSAFSPYWGFIFPKSKWLNFSENSNDQHYYERWKSEYEKTFKFISYKNNGKQLVLKNPPNTERIRLILELFPDAKFIYIYRNPFHLFYSMRNMWKKAILKYYCLQNLSESELEDVIFQHYNHLISQYENEKELIPDKNLVEVQFEELESHPLLLIKRIYYELNIPDFEIAEVRIRQQIQEEKKYKKFEYKFSTETYERIKSQWGRKINKDEYASMNEIT